MLEEEETTGETLDETQAPTKTHQVTFRHVHCLVKRGTDSFIGKLGVVDLPPNCLKTMVGAKRILPLQKPRAFVHI